MAYHWTLGSVNLTIRGPRVFAGDLGGVGDRPSSCTDGKRCPASSIYSKELVVRGYHWYMEVRVLEIHAGHPLGA